VHVLVIIVNIDNMHGEKLKISHFISSVFPGESTPLQTDDVSASVETVG